jgi:hypothetical protein
VNFVRNCRIKICQKNFPDEIKVSSDQHLVAGTGRVLAVELGCHQVVGGGALPELGVALLERGAAVATWNQCCNFYKYIFEEKFGKKLLFN